MIGESRNQWRCVKGKGRKVYSDESCEREPKAIMAQLTTHGYEGAGEAGE